METGSTLMPGNRRLVRMKTASKLIDKYSEEAEKCGKSNAFFAGCVMVGAALEGILLIMTRAFPHQVRYRGHRVSERRTLGQLIHLAEECGWLDDLGRGHSRSILDARNQLHPDRIAGRKKIPRITRDDLDDRLIDLWGVRRSLRRFLLMAMVRSATRKR